MKTAAIAALQLLALSHVADSAILPFQHLGTLGQARESQQEFEDTTGRYKQSGQCRLYLDSTDKTRGGLGTCAQKCGDLVGEEDISKSPECTTSGDNVPEILDPEGDRYTPGECVCDVPIVDQMVDETLLPLPVVADIGCPIVYQAFDAILDVGAAAIPDEEAPMDIGMNASIQAAKTISDSGKEADSFLGWFDQPCEVGNYTDVILKIFNPLCEVPDSVVANTDGKTTNGKEKRSPKGGKGGSKSSGKSSSGSKPKAPAPKQDEKPPAKPPKKNDQSSEPAKKPDAATIRSDKKPTKAPESTKSSNTIVKPTSSVQTKSDKKKAPISNSNDPLTEATSEPQDDTLATPSASELDSLAVTATDEALNSVSITPSADVLDTGSVIATSDLPDALSEAPSASITDSPLSASQQPEDTKVQPVQTTENEITATALPASEDDSTIASAETLEDQSSLLDDPLAVTAEPQQTLEGEATATDQSLIAETGDASSVIETPSLPSLTDVGSSREPVETPLPTNLETSNSPALPKATIICTPRHQDASAVQATDATIVKRAPSGLIMGPAPGLGNTYVGFVPNSSGDVSCNDVVDYAEEGFNQIRNSPGIRQSVIVSALHVDGLGVIVASKPRAPIAESPLVAATLRSRAKHDFPEYSDMVEFRIAGSKDPLANWHAEDLALVTAAGHLRSLGVFVLENISGRAQISAWGKYGDIDPLGMKRPCWGDRADVQPSCTEVLTDLGVSIVVGRQQQSITTSAR
ncbi:MAG: hypothetical protein Q9205_005198 [Flavoplaca limonia]